MFAALVKALGVVAVNAGDVFTEVCNLVVFLPVFGALQEIIELVAG